MQFKKLGKSDPAPLALGNLSPSLHYWKCSSYQTPACTEHRAGRTGVQTSPYRITICITVWSPEVFSLIAQYNEYMGLIVGSSSLQPYNTTAASYFVLCLRLSLSFSFLSPLSYAQRSQKQYSALKRRVMHHRTKQRSKITSIFSHIELIYVRSHKEMVGELSSHHAPTKCQPGALTTPRFCLNSRESKFSASFFPLPDALRGMLICCYGG